MADCPALESSLLADPNYAAIWGDPKRRDDLALILSSVSQLITVGSKDGKTNLDEALFAPLARRKLTSIGVGGGGIPMTLDSYDFKAGTFPADFATRMTTFLASIAAEPHRGTWAPAKGAGTPKDFSALAYLVHRDDSEYLREFIAAKKDGPFKWMNVKDPIRPYLVRERAALERLSLLAALTPSEDARLAVLRESNWSDEYVEWVDLTKLLHEYKSNEVRADSEYQGHVVEVTGILGGVKKDISDSIYATIGTGEYMEEYHVQCFVRDRFATKVSGLIKGQNVTMTGKVKGLSMFSVVVEDCELAN